MSGAVPLITIHERQDALVSKGHGKVQAREGETTTVCCEGDSSDEKGTTSASCDEGQCHRSLKPRKWLKFYNNSVY